MSRRAKAWLCGVVPLASLWCSSSRLVVRTRWRDQLAIAENLLGSGFVRWGCGTAPTFATSTRLAFVAKNKDIRTARVLTPLAGLMLHEFPKHMMIPASVSENALRTMVGNCQHVRCAAAVWVLGAALLRGDVAAAKPEPAGAKLFVLRLKLPCCSYNKLHETSWSILLDALRSFKVDRVWVLLGGGAGAVKEEE